MNSVAFISGVPKTNNPAVVEEHKVKSSFGRLYIKLQAFQLDMKELRRQLSHLYLCKGFQASIGLCRN